MQDYKKLLSHFKNATNALKRGSVRFFKIYFAHFEKEFAKQILSFTKKQQDYLSALHQLLLTAKGNVPNIARALCIVQEEVKEVTWKIAFISKEPETAASLIMIAKKACQSSNLSDRNKCRKVFLANEIGCKDNNPNLWAIRKELLAPYIDYNFILQLCNNY